MSNVKRQRIPARQKEQREKMSDVQMCWSLCAECVEFLSQRRSGAVLMESRHGEGQTDKQKLYQRKRSDFCLFHKPSELAHSLSFCSCVCFCLYGPFNCISFR